MVTGAADTAAVLTAAEAGVVLADEAGGLLSVRIEADARCLKQFAATAKKSARFLLDPQTVNRFIAVIVLKKWVVAEEAIHGGLMTGAVLPKLKVDRIWAQLTPNWIKF